MLKARSEGKFQRSALLSMEKRSLCVLGFTIFDFKVVLISWLVLILGKGMVFFELRQQTDTIQALLTISNTVSKQMHKFAGSINPESIILIRGTVQKSPEEIKRTTVKDAEILIEEVNPIREIAIAYGDIDLGCLRVSFSVAIPDRRCAATGDRRRIEYRRGGRDDRAGGQR